MPRNGGISVSDRKTAKTIVLSKSGMSIALVILSLRCSAAVHHYFASLRMRSIALSVSVCLSSRISQRPHNQTSRNSPYMLTVAAARSSSDNGAIYVRYFRFCEWRHVFT